MSETRLELRDVTRTFEQAGEKLDVLRGINFAIHPGELVALVGPSGSGKSTLLHVAGLLEAPTTGTVLVNGEVAGDLDDASRTALRRRTIGFVYQAHHLLPEFSALENVVVPQMLNGISKRDAAARAQELLERVGLGHRTTHRPARLSGGEQQRVAIVRALANQPALLLADEPTGNLDPHTAEDAFAMLAELVRSTGVGALIATHNFDLAGRMDRVLRLQDGRVESA
ncbi:ABC transporter ATP-binding protein [Roseiterribacter gracilis]|uniref:Lipoprotein-releasing system ATP-binding protein LolD 1 n=1 Tax=Roseiterribacter gracilis TaxID=2812848 RepID=A0A8S8XAG4_9PROT|nr:lipoprotein-releasing system ATP-binding protein LolD 1 [Rhodospirillales bacterium TMPK1]